MKHINDFSDERNKSWCIHCGQWISAVEVNRDHVPTKSLLKKPYPPEMPVIQVCKECNEGFSLDEEYFSVFLSCAILGSTDPADHEDDNIRDKLGENPDLRMRIESSRTVYKTLGGVIKCYWKPEQKRINRIILKNARGHVFFEYGEPLLSDPEYVQCRPLEYFSCDEREEFENINSGSIWAEVGSRMLNRYVIGHDMRNGWVIVQDGGYRYALNQEGTMLVRIVIGEYLAAEIFWA